MKNINHFSELNDSQKEAVETINGPLLVLAGAGTGKTRVLTSRLSYILQNNIAHPSEICTVTFTNKAANEMRIRVEKMIGNFERMFGSKPKHNVVSPLEKGDHPELDESEDNIFSKCLISLNK